MLDPHEIDPGGPIDPAVPGPQPVDEMSRPAAFTLMAPGWYPPEHAITQAYGFCFTDHGLVALVQTDDGFCNLPAIGSNPERPRATPSCARSPRRPAPA